jgi:hypothetical protein
MYLLLLGLLSSELLTRDRQLSLVMKNVAGRGTRNTYELRFDRPWKRRPTVFYEDIVGIESVNIFGVKEKAIYVEDADAYGGETIHFTVNLTYIYIKVSHTILCTKGWMKFSLEK